MSPPPSSSALLPLPMPGTPAWRARIASIFSSADSHVLLAFWLFGACLAVSLPFPLPPSPFRDLLDEPVAVL